MCKKRSDFFGTIMEKSHPIKLLPKTLIVTENKAEKGGW